jgi:hypothetical protein
MSSRTLPRFLAATAALLSFQQAPVATADLLEQLQSCARVKEQQARFACYEALGQEALKQSPSDEPGSGGAPVVAAPAAAAAQPGEKPSAEDTIGGYRFEEPSEDPDEDALATRVVECQKSFEGIWYFRLENGQVWKQVDRQTLNFQACDFPVTVANDGLGYVLRIEGRKGKIRISRRK